MTVAPVRQLKDNREVGSWAVIFFRYQPFLLKNDAITKIKLVNAMSNSKVTINNLVQNYVNHKAPLLSLVLVKGVKDKSAPITEMKGTTATVWCSPGTEVP